MMMTLTTTTSNLISVIITAAGSSTRIGGGIKKEYLPYKNGTVISTCAKTFLNAIATKYTISNFIIMSALGWIDTYWSLIIPAFGSTLGFYLMRQFMDSTVPDSVLESARLDGAKEILIYWRIVMPMVKPAWLTLIVYCFQGLWNAGSSRYIHSEQLKSFNYAITQILAGGIKRSGAGAASTIIMMIVPLLVFVITQSNIIETMGSSGMKD